MSSSSNRGTLVEYLIKQQAPPRTPSRDGGKTWERVRAPYAEEDAASAARFLPERFDTALLPSAEEREEEQEYQRQRRAASIDLAERLVRDAHGSFMPLFDKEGTERHTERKVRIVPPQERLFPGWVLDANQLIALSGLEPSASFCAQLMRQGIRLPGDVDQETTLQELMQLMGERVREMDRWAQSRSASASTTNSYARELEEDFERLLRTANELQLGSTNREALELIVEAAAQGASGEAARGVARTYGAAMLALEGVHAPVRVLCWGMGRGSGLGRERERRRNVRGSTDEATRDEANIARALYQYAAEVLVKETRLDAALLRVALEAVRRAITHLVVRHVTIARYVDYHSVDTADVTGFRSQGLSNKVTWWLTEYLSEGGMNVSASSEQETSEEAAAARWRSVRERELESMSLNAKQSGTLVAAFRWLERLVIVAKTDIDRELYAGMGAVVRQWWTESSARAGDMRTLAPQVAPVHFLWILKRVLRLYGEPSDYFKQKWAQDDFVLGGRNVYRPYLAARIRAFYESTTPFALAKAKRFLHEFTTNETVPNTVALERFRDDQLCRRLSAVENVAYRRALLGKVDRTRAEVIDVRPTGPLDKQADEDDAMEVQEEDWETEAEEEEQEEEIRVTELVVQDTECMDVVFQRTRRTDLPEQISDRDLLQLAQTLQDDSASLSLEQFDFLIHHALGRIVPTLLFVAPVADLARLRGEASQSAGPSMLYYEKRYQEARPSPDQMPKRGILVVPFYDSSQRTSVGESGVRGFGLLVHDVARRESYLYYNGNDLGSPDAALSKLSVITDGSESYREVIVNPSPPVRAALGETQRPLGVSHRVQLPGDASVLERALNVLMIAQQMITSPKVVRTQDEFAETLFPVTRLEAERRERFRYHREKVLASVYALQIFAKNSEVTRGLFENQKRVIERQRRGRA